MRDGDAAKVEEYGELVLGFEFPREMRVDGGGQVAGFIKEDAEACRYNSECVGWI